MLYKSNKDQIKPNSPTSFTPSFFAEISGRYVNFNCIKIHLQSIVLS